MSSRGKTPYTYLAPARRIILALRRLHAFPRTTPNRRRGSRTIVFAPGSVSASRPFHSARARLLCGVTIVCVRPTGPASAARLSRVAVPLSELCRPVVDASSTLPASQAVVLEVQAPRRPVRAHIDVKTVVTLSLVHTCVHTVIILLLTSEPGLLVD